MNKTLTTSIYKIACTRTPCHTIKPLHKPSFCKYRRMASSTAPGPTASGSSAPEKFEWLVVLPDREGSLEKRLAVRPKHLAGLTPKLQSGFWKMGGAYLNSTPQPDTTPSFAGSCMIAYASSKEEVLAAINEDVYAREGVWDLGKMTIHLFKAAFREALPFP